MYARYEPPYLIISDQEINHQKSKLTLSEFMFVCFRNYIGVAKKRPRNWVLLDEEDFKELLAYANKGR